MLRKIVRTALILASSGVVCSLVACAPGASGATPPVVTPGVNITPVTQAPLREDVAPPPTPGPERDDPGEVVLGFYNWYLGYEGNALVDGAYRDQAVASPEFAQTVQERLDSFEKGGYDPILCAQDQPGTVEVGMVTISGDRAEVAVSTSFEGHSFRVLLAAEEQSWQITDVVCDNGDAPASAPEDASPGDVSSGDASEQASAGGPREIVPGWPVLIDDTWHFQVQYPEGWTIEDVDLDDPNKPPAGQMDRLVFFWPDGWDQDFVVFQMEVYDLDDDAFAMAFIPATSEEDIVRDDGVVYTKYLHEFGEYTMVQYGFRSATHPNVRVIFTECVTGWPDRIAGNEDIAAVYEPMIQSFGFTE